jgi:hypothetical protein
MCWQWWWSTSEHTKCYEIESVLWLFLERALHETLLNQLGVCLRPMVDNHYCSLLTIFIFRYPTGTAVAVRDYFLVSFFPLNHPTGEKAVGESK